MFKGMLLIKRYFQNKGLFFCLNILVLLAMIFLISQLFDYKSSNSFILGYSIKYFVYCLFFIVLTAFYSVLALIKNDAFNRKLFFTTVACFLILELGISSLSFQKVSTPSRNAVYLENSWLEPKPYVMFGAVPKRGSKIKLNKLGFRVENGLSKQKPHGEIRIFVLGGSTVYDGFPLRNSISGQIEKFLYKDGYKNVKVYNFGAVGFVSGQELSLILHTVVDYHPDVVIVYDGGNDINLPYSYDPRPGYPFNFYIQEEAMNLLKNKQSVSQLFLSMLRKSKLIGLILTNAPQHTILSLKPIKEDANYGSSEWENLVVSKYISNLEKTCNLAKGFDFKLMVFLQPLIYFKPSLTGQEKQLLNGKQFQDYVNRQYNKIRLVFSVLNEKYNKEGRCFFFDLSYIFKDYDRQLFRNDFIHTNNLARHLVAKQIYECIKKTEILQQHGNE